MHSRLSLVNLPRKDLTERGYLEVNTRMLNIIFLVAQLLNSYGCHYFALIKSRRNEWIFGEQNVRRESVLLQSQRMQREVVAVISPLKAIAATRHVDQSHPAIVDRRINPPGGWCKLNTDRAVDRVLNLASCGGVIRDE
ncbi:hypothetical protein V6N12_003659 [Hibiscus sabdariffa]|uniref:Uncharacterized protein n=1 Tax=Hibiscus sabdariffa TaxID=183260 RepID=A0ABR2AIH7_9ROSI